MTERQFNSKQVLQDTFMRVQADYQRAQIGREINFDKEGVLK